MKNLPLICFMLLGLAHAQQPAYFMLGEKQFEGVEIYSTIQDNKLNYWFATNEGLYYYDNYQYRLVTHPEMRSKSLFGFVKDENGKIYCHSFNNQVFSIQDDSLKLFHEFEGDKGDPYMTLHIVDKTNLLIKHGQLTLLNSKGKLLSSFQSSEHYIHESYTTKSGKTFTHLTRLDSIVVLENAVFSTEHISLPENFETESLALTFFSFNKKLLAIDKSTNTIFEVKSNPLALKKLQPENFIEKREFLRVYETEEAIWMAGTSNGVYVLKKNSKSLRFEKWYSNFFISGITTDLEGNTLLSTFENGLIVIPNMNTPDVIAELKPYQVVSVAHSPLNGLLFGTASGQLINLTKRGTTVIVKGGENPLKNIFPSPTSAWVLYDNHHLKVLNINTGKQVEFPTYPLKGAAYCKDSSVCIATSIGLFVLSPEKNMSQITKETRLRTYNIAHTSQNGDIYAATASGIKWVPNKGEPKELFSNGKNIYASHVVANNKTCYALMQGKEILKLRNGKVVGNVVPQSNGSSFSIIDFTLVNNEILANTSDGLMRFDTTGNLLCHYNNSIGFSSNKIYDFEVVNDTILVIHSRGVQRIPYYQKTDKATKPHLNFSSLLVNNNKTDFTKTGSFSYDQRRVQLTFSSPTLRNQQNIRYHYKLVGYDDKWVTSPYEQNTFIYNALGPGEYTFVVKAENNKVFSKAITYSFSISSPFYKKWWFTTLIALIAIAIIFLIFRARLQVQQRKAKIQNMLNASRLTAIQSQMNPHFIFNALNSIQDLVLKGDIDNSYTFITKFANLVRKTLKYSEKDFVDFEQELELLELYLSLEKLRFKESFSYQITAENISDIELPPMLIQPFVENALVHGLLHKQGEKKLTINFKLEQMLICEIEDNGVGREKAKEIKQRQKGSHESFSGRAINKRFEILGNYFDEKPGCEYNDLFENGKPSGTKVTVNIPVKRKF